MPPHCDSLDGPVVVAARQALAAGDVELILPFVPSESEEEVRDAYGLAMKARAAGGESTEVADRWFFETAVRVHRAGEGAPFTGLRPAGLDVGPVIPLAEQALKDGSADELADLLCRAVEAQVEARHAHAMELGRRSEESVAQAREYVQAALGLQVWAHHLYQQILAGTHEAAAGHGHG